MNKKICHIIPIFSFLFIVIMWQILSLIIHAELILPSPKNVFITVLKIIQNQSFWIHFLHTFQRIIISFIISIFFGTILGICCGLNPYVNQFFKLPISILRATPIVAFILIALFWFNSSTIPIFVSVVMTLPLISTSVVSGFENTEEKILQMAKIYNFTFFQKLMYIKFHYVFPYFLSGISSAFGLTWKVVVAGEIISLPKKAVGTIMSQAQVHLETQQVIAYTIILVLISFSLETIFGFVIKKILKGQNASSKNK